MLAFKQAAGAAETETAMVVVSGSGSSAVSKMVTRGGSSEREKGVAGLSLFKGCKYRCGFASTVLYTM